MIHLLRIQDSERASPSKEESASGWQRGVKREGSRGTKRWCASRISVLAFHNKVQTRGNASNSVTGAFADSTCLYLSRRYSTNYVCLLSNAQFVYAATVPEPVTLTILSISKDLVTLPFRYFSNRIC